MKKKEVLIALIEGRVFKYLGHTIEYSEEFSIPFVLNGPYIEDKKPIWEAIEDWVEIKEWYEDLPKQGIMCRVWDTNDNKVIRVITLHDDCVFYDDYAVYWGNAEPLTLEELKEFIL